MRQAINKRTKYNVKNVDEAKQISSLWLSQLSTSSLISFGLPEVDDRYHIWRVPLIKHSAKQKIGEIVIDAFTTLIDENKTTKPEVLEKRILNGGSKSISVLRRRSENYQISTQRNTIALGDAELVLQDMAAKSVDLIFTSPPYYNARPEYSDYITYEDYLLKLRKVIQSCHRVLNEGRFFVMNISPVLLRRASRSEASKRIAVPFDVHKLFIEEGFDFIDDIHWVKPEGAGWATGRGRRFAADRNPLQYKPVPVTEYVLVYRKHTDKLIDWNIRNYPNKEIIKTSKIDGKYDVTNIWKISPSYDKRHPAIFPLELAERVIRYYSFRTDVVLDPFAGIGTVGKAATKLDRRFVLIDINPKYVKVMKTEAKKWLGKKSEDILYLNCEPDNTGQEVIF
jgi:DNA modification methylase